MALKLHADVTIERVLELTQESMFGTSDDGICVACGEEACGVESDARGYECDYCGKPAVYGAETLLMMLA